MGEGWDWLGELDSMSVREWRGLTPSMREHYRQRAEEQAAREAVGPSTDEQIAELEARLRVLRGADRG